MVTIAADALLRLARHRRRTHFTELAHRRVNSEITSWPDFFAAVADRPLLAKLDDYRDPLLIAGCPRAAVCTSGGRDPARLLDVADAAALLGTSVDHVRKLVFARKIPYLKVGKYVRFERPVLAEWIIDNRQ